MNKVTLINISILKYEYKPGSIGERCVHITQISDKKWYAPYGRRKAEGSSRR